MNFARTSIQLAGRLERSSTRGLVQRFFSSSQRNYYNTSSYKKWAVAVGSFAAATTIWYNDTYYFSDVKNADDTAFAIENSVSVDKSIPPFPKVITDPLAEEFQLLGYGVRTVTFLRMKVYGLGIYISKKDVANVPKILDSKFLSSFYENLGDHEHLSHNEKLLKALEDPNLSTILIDNLLASGIKFTARIVPLRNTDFNHLRDGLVKSIMASPKAKEALQQENSPLPEGIDDLRKVFGNKHGSCPKGQSLYLELLEDQTLAVKYQFKDKNSRKVETTLLGIVKEPLVGKMLFLQYLSGKNPLSNETKTKSVESLASLA